MRKIGKAFFITPKSVAKKGGSTLNNILIRIIFFFIDRYNKKVDFIHIILFFFQVFYMNVHVSQSNCDFFVPIFILVKISVNKLLFEV